MIGGKQIRIRTEKQGRGGDGKSPESLLLLEAKEKNSDQEAGRAMGLRPGKGNRNLRNQLAWQKKQKLGKHI
jgi:hypothetical protein